MVEEKVSICGLCESCDNRSLCDFMKDIKIFIRDEKCAKKIVDTEVTVYSCDEYELKETGCPYCDDFENK